MAISIQDKKEVLYALQASSVDELRATLPMGDVVPKSAVRFVAIAINSPHVLVCPFVFDDVEKRELKDQLMLRAVELLSLPLDGIGLDYQVFESKEGTVRGIFTCYPKEILQGYLSVLDESGFVPIKIVPTIVAGMDSFLYKNRQQKGRFCLLDFSRANVIHFAVFSNGHCDFLREIPYDETDEIEREVMQSLRCACATSSVKQFDHIYLSGNVPDREELTEKLSKFFCENVTHGKFTDIETSLRSSDNLLTLNLVKDRTFSLKQREVITQATRAVLSLCCAMAIILSVKIFAAELKMRNIKASYRASEYQHALELDRQIKAK